jgi:hypothetical protein
MLQTCSQAPMSHQKPFKRVIVSAADEFVRACMKPSTPPTEMAMDGVDDGEELHGPQAPETEPVEVEEEAQGVQPPPYQFPPEDPTDRLAGLRYWGKVLTATAVTSGSIIAGQQNSTALLNFCAVTTANIVGAATPPNFALGAACGAWAAAAWYFRPRPVVKAVFPDVRSEIEALAAEHCLDQELLAHVLRKTPRQKKTPLLAQSMEYMAEQWLREHRSSWSEVDKAAQVGGLVRVLMTSTVIERGHLACWDNKQDLEAMQVVNRWQKEGLLPSGARMELH